MSGDTGEVDADEKSPRVVRRIRYAFRSLYSICPSVIRTRDGIHMDDCSGGASAPSFLCTPLVIYWIHPTDFAVSLENSKVFLGPHPERSYQRLKQQGINMVRFQ